MTTTLRQEIDALVLEHDVAALASLLEQYERECDDTRAILYAAIDRAAAMLLLDAEVYQLEEARS
jgi:hypothetical protein